MRIPTSHGEYIEIPLKPIIGGLLVALLLGLGSTAVFQVDPEEEGVVLRFGKQVSRVPPGLHFKFPYPIDEVLKVPVRIVDVLEFGYRTGGGQRTDRFASEASMLTGDLNIVLAGFDVQFSREDPANFLFNVKEPTDTLRDISQSVMREIMGDRASIPILTVGRAEIQARARELIQTYIDQFEMGIRVNEVNLIFVNPPDEVRAAFNDLNKAEQDAVRFLEEASREYQDKVPQARGQAERHVLEAEGFRETRVRTAQGEADRFNSVLEAYIQAPEVTRRRLYLEHMERRLPELSKVIIMDESVNSPLPLLNLNQEAQ
ncbi:MAG: FtsH protease activity modulator HflK [Verrucomicrobiae bacterium]|nr:FtsH protease activity modulator HflK [Verrucomicrobiae bacterium]